MLTGKETAKAEVKKQSDKEQKGKAPASDQKKNGPKIFFNSNVKVQNHLFLMVQSLSIVIRVDSE